MQIVQFQTASDALAKLVETCPALVNVRRADGRLAPQYLLSLDGERFVGDLEEPLRDGDRLLLLSADSGG